MVALPARLEPPFDNPLLQAKQDVALAFPETVGEEGARRVDTVQSKAVVHRWTGHLSA
jgi:hypothetical protein